MATSRPIYPNQLTLSFLLQRLNALMIANPILQSQPIDSIEREMSRSLNLGVSNFNAILQQAGLTFDTLYHASCLPLDLLNICPQLNLPLQALRSHPVDLNLKSLIALHDIKQQAFAASQAVARQTQESQTLKQQIVELAMYQEALLRKNKELEVDQEILKQQAFAASQEVARQTQESQTLKQQIVELKMQQEELLSNNEKLEVGQEKLAEKLKKTIKKLDDKTMALQAIKFEIKEFKKAEKKSRKQEHKLNEDIVELKNKKKRLREEIKSLTKKKYQLKARNKKLDQSSRASSALPPQESQQGILTSESQLAALQQQPYEPVLMQDFLSVVKPNGLTFFSPLASTGDPTQKSFDQLELVELQRVDSAELAAAWEQVLQAEDEAKRVGGRFWIKF